MNPRVARRLVALYPGTWRARYGEEFAGFLEAHPATIGVVLDVVVSALQERLRGSRDMAPQQRSLIMMTCAYLAAGAAGVNFYFSVDDTPLAAAMRSHAALSIAFGLVAKSSFVALAAAGAAAVPLTIRIVRVSLAARRWDLIGRLLVPPASAAVTAAWLLLASVWTGTRWVPLPWDVGGDWAAPADWPPLAVRWPLGTVTFALLLSGLAASAWSVGQAIARCEPGHQRRGWLASAAVALAVSISAMAAGVLAWGWYAEQLAQAAFHARNGGLFVSTNIASWTASALVFAIAAAISVRAARVAIASNAG